MSSAIAAPAVALPARRLSLAGLIVLALGSADFGLESSIVLPALPVFAAEFDASLVSVSWLATGFLLASVVAVPLCGRLGDIFGRRRLLFVCLGAFAAGSLLCAVADSIGLLIAGRIAQGTGAAVGPLALGIARDALPPERLRPAIGILVGAGGAGAAIGYLLSGVLVDHVSLASIFWLLFAVAIVLLAAAPAVVPPSPARSREPVDLAGAALVAGGLGALLLAISKGNDWGWYSARVLGLFAAAAVLLAAFVLVERRVRHPLVELAFVARRPFSPAAVCSFTVGFTMAGAPLAVPQLVSLPAVTGYGLGYSTTQAGLVLVPMALSTMVAAYAAGRLVEGVGPRALVAAGAVCAAIAYVSLAVAHETGGQIAAATGVLGIAVGLGITGIAAVVVPSAPVDKTSVAVAVPNIVRTTGIAVGAAVSAAIITGALTVGPVPAETGYTRAFVAGAIAGVCALLAAALLPGRAARPPAG